MAKQSLSRGGVFGEGVDDQVARFSCSIQVDRRLYRQDIAGSIAHAEMLAQQGLITRDESQKICQALEAIRDDIESGRFQFRQELEDVHLNIEQALIDRLGDVGRKLHTARSRNDQVATDLRLWVRDAIDATDERLLRLQRAFVGRSDGEIEVIVPGYTHFRRAQPVLVVHYWLAYCEKFARDRLRLADCRKRVNVLPLGTAALAGTSLAIDREQVAQALGFAEVSSNSLDASSDRDFVLEFAFVLALIAEHLSGWAEEWILWSTTEFDFLRLPQAFCTGSSIMPQKINPDVLELIRGKTGRVVGALQSLLVLIKGLPMAYNRDLQEDKEPLFAAFDTVSECLEIAAPLVERATLHREAIRSRLDQGFLDATTLMEYMMGRGVPQRVAHHAVGTLVRTAMERGVRLADLTLDDFRQQWPEADPGLFGVLGVANAVQAFASYGSTAPPQVAEQLQRWKRQLGM